MERKVSRLGAYVVVNAQNKILLSLLNRGPHSGKWNLPGGRIEFGEHPDDTVKRELLEECSVTLEVKPKLMTCLSDTYSYIDVDGKNEILHVVGIIHSLALPTIVSCKTESDGDSSDGSKWFDIDCVRPSEVTPFVVQALEFYRAVESSR